MTFLREAGPTLQDRLFIFKIRMRVSKCIAGSSVKSKANCVACHKDAEKGNFDGD
jgi:hypothetical protein